MPTTLKETKYYDKSRRKDLRQYNQQIRKNERQAARLKRRERYSKEGRGLKVGKAVKDFGEKLLDSEVAKTLTGAVAKKLTSPMFEGDGFTIRK